MADDKLEQALSAVDPKKRDLLKKMLVGAAFAVPTVASFSVRDLAYGQISSPITSVTVVDQ